MEMQQILHGLRKAGHETIPPSKLRVYVELLAGWHFNRRCPTYREILRRLGWGGMGYVQTVIHEFRDSGLTAEPEPGPESVNLSRCSFPNYRLELTEEGVHALERVKAARLAKEAGASRRGEAAPG